MVCDGNIPDVCNLFEAIGTYCFRTTVILVDLNFVGLELLDKPREHFSIRDLVCL